MGIRRDPTVALAVHRSDFDHANWASRSPVSSQDETLEMHKLLVAVHDHGVDSLDVSIALLALSQGLTGRRVVHTPLLVAPIMPVEHEVPSSFCRRQYGCLSSPFIKGNSPCKLLGCSSHADAVLSQGVRPDISKSSGIDIATSPLTLALSQYDLHPTFSEHPVRSKPEETGSRTSRCTLKVVRQLQHGDRHLAL